MSKKECYFCHGGDKFILDAEKSIQNQLDNPIDLIGHRICQLCSKVLVAKAIDKEFKSLGFPGYKI